MNKLAEIKFAPKEGFTGPGEGPLSAPGAQAGEIFNNIISASIGLMTIVAFIWFVFLLLSGAYGIMSAGGDKAKMETARSRITNGVVGVVVVIAAIFVVRLIATLLGVESVLDPASALDSMLENLGL